MLVMRLGMLGKWHLGSDPDSRSPDDFGFDEAVWCSTYRRRGLLDDAVVFPNGDVTVGALRWFHEIRSSRS